MNKYSNDDLNNPKYLFHGSPKKLDIVEQRKSSDSSGNKDNIDNVVFLTSSYLIASAYAFKDTIKEKSFNLKWSFDISNRDTIPVMTMRNVVIDRNSVGYIYIFRNDNNLKASPSGSLQFKAYSDLLPIDVVEVEYKDFEKYYKVI